jgi:hypothetical protein
MRTERARGQIALCEVRACVFAGKRAETLDNEAELLRCRFEAAFWDEPLGTYVPALDGDKRPCRVAGLPRAGRLLLRAAAILIPGFLPHLARAAHPRPIHPNSLNC